MNRPRELILGLSLAAFAALAIGCSSDPNSPSTGQVSVLLTDAPIDMTGVSAVRVTVDEILLFADADAGSDESGLEMDQPGISAGQGLTLNLLDFQNGQTILVATLGVPDGRYEKLRIKVATAELVRDDDGDPATPELVEPIFVPSGKVDIPIPFDIGRGESAELVIDFDAAASVQVNETPGNHLYILRPVITPVRVTVG